TLLVTDVAVGFLARIAPQMNIFRIELPAKVLATFALLIVTAPFLVEGIAGRFDTGLDFTLRLITEMGATNRWSARPGFASLSPAPASRRSRCAPSPAPAAAGPSAASAAPAAAAPSCS